MSRPDRLPQPTAAGRLATMLVALVALAGLAACGSRGVPLVSTAQDDDRLVHESQQVALLDQGFDALVQRVALIRSARSRIDVQTFIYADDTCGRLLLAELAAAADRGVRVRLLIDAMFCAIPAADLARLRHDHPGFAIALYNPRPKEVVEARQELQDEVDAGLNHRMHNKLLVVDGASGITGGRNHEDTYFDVGRGLNYRDREVLVHGASARQMAACAAAWWFHPLVVPVDELIAVRAAAPTAADPATVAARPEEIRPADVLPVEDLAPRLGRLRAAIDAQLAAGARPAWREVASAAFCWDVPGRSETAESSSTIAGLHQLMKAATTRIDLVSPYCVLNSGSLDNLQALRERGIALVVHTNSLASTDAWWAFGGYLRDRRRLIATGVELSESRPHPADIAEMWSMDPAVVALRQGGTREPFLSLHAKCLVADDQVAVVGTFNLDPRSRHTNTEQVLIMWDAGIAGELARRMRADAAPRNAWRVGLRHRSMGWFHAPFIRLSEWTGDWLSLDLYPVQATTCYDLRPGGTAVPYGDPAFLDQWSDAGPKPEADEETARRAAAMQTFGAVITPLL